ncbi:MAG: hypothetical protein Q7T82_21090 [Armatimonadota bacterium]|nr:hypothetical protein [Armatimonadota bacterium]
MDYDKVLSTVKRHADTLIYEGTDTYGDIHTPLFCYQLDVRTHKPPHRDINPMCVSFDASFQSRCSNMDYDNDNFRMLYKLSKLTGDKSYSDAADACMAYFMENCVSPTTGLFGWGEHIYYNVFTDDFNYRGHDGHEFEGLITLWDEMWRINPAAVKREIEAIHEYHIHDPANYNFDRHAHWVNGHNDGVGFINHGMNYVYCFAFLHKVTGTQEYLDWAVKLTNSRYEARDENGMAPACVVRDSRGNHHTEYICPYAQGGGADFLTYAYIEHPEPLFIKAAEDYLKASFAYELDKVLSKAREDQQGEEGGANLAGFTQGLLNLYEATGDTWGLDKAKAITELEPRYTMKGGEDWGAAEAWCCAQGILDGVRLHELTGEQKWLDIAMGKAQYARDFLFEGDLFRYTSEGQVSDRYCARTDAILGRAFADLAERLRG